jgi:hypothetical protein
MALSVGCVDDLLLSLRNLEIAPNPAQPGQPVSFVVDLVVIPEHNFTITALIDDEVHTSETRQALFDGLFEFEMGDAADMIAQYGVGLHLGQVRIRLNDGGQTSQTQQVQFELQDTPAPAP